jgi:hypothetical protein
MGEPGRESGSKIGVAAASSTGRDQGSLPSRHADNILSCTFYRTAFHRS